MIYSIPPQRETEAVAEQATETAEDHNPLLKVNPFEVSNNVAYAVTDTGYIYKKCFVNYRH